MPTDRPGGDPLARISQTPQLARVVARLPAEVLQRVVCDYGLERCAEFLALATTEQLSAVFDLDLWRAARPGAEERFDAARFAEWLEMFADAGAAAAADRLAALDPALVVAGLAGQIAVFDPAVFSPSVESDGADDVVSPGRALGLHREIGGYFVVARRTDSWDTLVDVLIALDEQHRESFHRIMRGCRRLSNSTPEVDGLHDLPGDSAQLLFDLALGREERRERQGFVTPPQARAFLESRISPEQSAAPTHPVLAASLRSAAAPAMAGDSTSSDSTAAAAVVDVLREAGVLREPPRALLAGSEEHQPRFACLQRHLEVVRDRDDVVHALRSQELAFLANVLVAGCSLQGRPFTVREASDGAAAICNLGLENWTGTNVSDDFLLDHDLATVFHAGWTVLHRDVSNAAAEQLLRTIADLQCSDREIQLGLYVLGRELTKQWQAGTPWRARNALEVIAMLDMPAWAALCGLIDEFPVMLANVSASGASRPRSISPSAFEFISGNAQVASVRRFLQSLPELISG